MKKALFILLALVALFSLLVTAGCELADEASFWEWLIMFLMN